MNYEKVSVNIDDKKLASIDLLVENGFYNNRTDFINQAVTNLLFNEKKLLNKLLDNKEEDANIINDKVWFIGVSCFTKEYLLKIKSLKTKINIKGFGVLKFSSDCDDELIKETVATISKKIQLNASSKLKEYYKTR